MKSESGSRYLGELKASCPDCWQAAVWFDLCFQHDASGAENFKIREMLDAKLSPREAFAAICSLLEKHAALPDFPAALKDALVQSRHSSFFDFVSNRLGFPLWELVAWRRK